MIKLIIWSKDRACQLDLLLRSIKQFAPDIFDMVVIYTFSNDNFSDGYAKLINENQKLRWLYQSDKVLFKEFTLDEIEFTKLDHICFSTDDEVIFKEVDSIRLQSNLPTHDNHLFSLRLGYNTIQQDIHRGTIQPPLNIHSNNDGILKWPINFYNPSDNYGYFGSLDMNVYRRNLLLDLLNQFNWSNTNELEGGLTQFRHKCDYISSFEQSVAVNIPCNNMSGYTVAGQRYGYTNEELNKKYLEGYKIDLDRINKTSIKGCHQEIPFSFIKGGVQ